MRCLYLIVGLVLFVSHACRSIKKSAEAAQMELSMQSELSDKAWSFYDSAASYWYYQSDSPFYYHPDKGLYGQSGRLAASGKQVQHEQRQQKQQHTAYELHAQQEEKHSWQPAIRSKLVYGAIGIVLLLILRQLWQRYRLFYRR